MESIFKYVEEPTKINPPLGVILGKSTTRGSIGLEVECEGNKFQKTDLPKPWGYHSDGSLRGEDNAEYVLKNPIEFEEVPAALDALWEMFKSYGTVLSESNRTSVHVHLNVQAWHLNRLTSFLAMYFALEELLTAWCGEHRVGNLFCLRAKDAPDIISQLKIFIKKDGMWEIDEGFHYAGLNAQALHKFGSIEIRTLRGPTNKDVILDWVQILERLYTLSADYPDPREICHLFSAGGPLNFLSVLLGPKEFVLRSAINYDDEMVRDAMYYGIRLVQDLVYCRNWSEYTPTDFKPDPFKRDPSVVMASIAANTAPGISQYGAFAIAEESPPSPHNLAGATLIQQLNNTAYQIYANESSPEITQGPGNTPSLTAWGVWSSQQVAADPDAPDIEEEEDELDTWEEPEEDEDHGF